MARRYNETMPAGQPHLPLLWLLSDARNDAGLEEALRTLPSGSGFVFRHYHLAPDARRARFDALRKVAKARGHSVIVAGDPVGADADGAYGAAERIAKAPGLRLATAHNGEEIARAIAAGADGIFLSPVFPTRSHPGADTLGVHGFHMLAKRSAIPVIALGGMTPETARLLDWPRWGAIDGFMPER